MAIKNSTGRRNMTVQKRKTFVLCVMSVAALLLLGGRVGYLMIFCPNKHCRLRWRYIKGRRTTEGRTIPLLEG